MEAQPVYKSKNITMCNDGRYRWVYELDMYKSQAIIKEVWRAILIAMVIVLAFMFVLNHRSIQSSRKSQCRKYHLEHTACHQHLLILS